jgi:hypothetical protein
MHSILHVVLPNGLVDSGLMANEQQWKKAREFPSVTSETPCLGPSLPVKPAAPFNLPYDYVQESAVTCAAARVS